MNVLFEKFKEVLFAVLPITVIVLVLNATITPLDTHLLFRFLLGAMLIILGLSIFLVGVDIGVSPIGTLMGSSLAKSNKLWVISIAGLLLGFFISIAEPGLHVLAEQVNNVTAGAISKLDLIIVVSIGIAAMLSLGLLRIVFNQPLYKILTLSYLLIFVFSLFTSSEFIAISFDASGAVTGAMTVPFILALGLGVSTLKKSGKASEEDSFGLVAITSLGAILSVIIKSIFSGLNEKVAGSIEYNLSEPTAIIAPFIQKLPIMFSEVFWAWLPLLIIFLIFQFVSFNLSKKSFNKILKGLVYVFIGLLLFLTGVNAGFMDVGSLVGYSVASLDSQWIIVLVGFILGLVVILAEPSVYVLTKQIENVTSGYIQRKAVLLALSIGVGFAGALSMLRIIVPEIQLWHYLLPGYLFSVIMTYLVPKLFVGIAFDSGVVASGPMTATFILAFAQGAAEAIEGASILDGFGVISMVTLSPLIAMHILGFIFRIKSIKGGIESHGK